MKDFEPPVLPASFSGTYSHWFPLITLCPVSGLPDVGFVSVSTKKFIEIYAMRHAIYSLAFKKLFMEDLVITIRDGILRTDYRLVRSDFTVTYRMLFGKVEIEI